MAPSTPTEPNPRVLLAVVGAHLCGQSLNYQLTSRQATLVETTTTAPHYRLYALDTVPPKPGLVRDRPGSPGAGAIEVEVWELGVAEFGSYVAEVPAPLGIGRVQLAGVAEVPGFVCEPIGRGLTASGRPASPQGPAHRCPRGVVRTATQWRHSGRTSTPWSGSLAPRLRFVDGTEDPRPG